MLPLLALQVVIPAKRTLSFGRWDVWMRHSIDT
jgi:hypothetical protein